MFPDADPDPTGSETLGEMLNCFVPYDDSREGNLGDISIPYEIEFFSPSIREAAKKSKWQCLPEHWQ